MVTKLQFDRSRSFLVQLNNISWTRKIMQKGVTLFIFWIFSAALLTQRTNLPQDYSKCPYIALTGIEVLTHCLYWQPPQWNFLVLCVNIDSRPWQAKVWYLQYLALVNEDVTSCQVPEMYIIQSGWILSAKSVGNWFYSYSFQFIKLLPIVNIYCYSLLNECYAWVFFFSLTVSIPVWILWKAK
jgi:hypothetical protein